MKKAPAAPDQAEDTAPRPRNRRGQGPLLREEIIRAATALIVRTGSDQAVTLRSVAREVGIAAPSIYAHFPDRDAIVETVVIEAITQLHQAVTAAVTAHDDPVEALLAGCAAYVDFGVREPARYRVLFGWARPKPEAPAADVSGERGLDAFQVLVDNLDACVRAGRSASTDTYTDAVTLWTALHGQVTLRADLPDFDWPPTDTVEQMARLLGRINP
ncbi:TetR/AcrR family transcriptional regulator [Actinosynnema sp. NPDC047251]|uniref:Transcriptional regulator n=1 Tax=Saccharothrix espanaensis (strain ATCC 51144 / DSM 44229 / JCM 9112 / NBRC 15066 / NRRL 15764) TaxID=1179773 RepID=K0K3V3_SACES|nr:TetR/AcrR family transcriptional regulator [Saccharothrix espanaensis]CCH32267.1 Transcriptional regulator [Saccharothrix espanaensis DSM 44229]